MGEKGATSTTQGSHTEAVIRAHAAYLASILDLAGEAIVAIDEEHTVVLFNKAAELIFGYPADEIVGRSVDLLIPPRFHEAHHRGVARFAREGNDVEYMSQRGRVTGLRKNGMEFPAEASISKVRDNGRTTFITVMRDLTERERLETDLRERELQYRSIFESVSDGLFVNTLDDRLIDFNPAAAAMHGYTVEEFKQLRPEQFIHPDSYHVFLEYQEAVRAGRRFYARAVDLHKDGHAFPVEVHGAAFSYRGERHTLAVVRDISEQVEARRLLEQRVEERTRELQTLLEVSWTVTSALDFPTLLSLTLDQIERVVDFHGLAVYVAEGDHLRLLQYRGPLSHDELVTTWQRRTDTGSRLPDLRAPVIIADANTVDGEGSVWQAMARELPGGKRPYLASWMAVPLKQQSRIGGVLIFSHAVPDYYSQRHAELALALSNHIAVALENARLFEAVQRGSDRFRAISELGQHINSILDVDELISRAVRLIQETFGYYHVHLGLIDGDVVRLPATAGVWEDQPFCLHCASLQLHLGEEAICSQVASSGMPLIVPDISREPRYLHPTGAYGSGVVIPLQVKGKVIGLLDVEHREANAFDERDVAVLQLLANQVAVAIENGRLYQQAQSLAALQERQRLARELHDSVSQALYGIGLGTRTTLALLESNGLPEAKASALRQPLDYTMSLARTALAEMRALIFELRPESLAVEGLIPALTRRIDALCARHDMTVEAALQDEPPLPVEAKEVLYRVAQEALHNVVKHAHAAHVSVSLSTTGAVVSLEVRDDGCGFEPGQHFPGHLGLQSMRERVEGVGGVFGVESAPGAGTSIRVTLRIPARVRQSASLSH